jgi:uncharacterized protein (TIGR03085 family)
MLVVVRDGSRITISGARGEPRTSLMTTSSGYALAMWPMRSSTPSSEHSSATWFEELSSEAPTLLAPWTSRDLAAHLVLREHDHLAAPGLVLPGAWGRFAEQRRRALASRSFSWLVATIRSGPPPGFFRIGWVRRFPNLNEFFVHHEDVRRANDRAPRANEHAMDEALWRNVCQARRFLARRLQGAGLELQWKGTTETVRARPGEPTARVVGPPGELLLYLFGRTSAAQIEIDGPAAAVQAVC